MQIKDYNFEESFEPINQDFDKRVVVRTFNQKWQSSPQLGVQRIYLEKNNKGESSTVSSIVKFAPNSYFDKHTHDFGEEFIVLEGIFSDQHGDYPRGTYVRNPHNTSHIPFSKDGCTIFVKLRQFDIQDNLHVVKDTTKLPWLRGLIPGLSVMPLHEFSAEHVALVKWEPNTIFTKHKHWGGEEILVLEGTFYDEHGIYPKGSWIRSPHLSMHKPYTQNEGALIFVKTGHI